MSTMHIYGRRKTHRGFREKFSVGPDDIGHIPGLPTAEVKFVFHWRPFIHGYRVVNVDEDGVVKWEI